MVKGGRDILMQKYFRETVSKMGQFLDQNQKTSHDRPEVGRKLVDRLYSLVIYLIKIQVLK